MPEQQSLPYPPRDMLATECRLTSVRTVRLRFRRTVYMRRDIALAIAADTVDRLPLTSRTVLAAWFDLIYVSARGRGYRYGLLVHTEAPLERRVCHVLYGALTDCLPVAIYMCDADAYAEDETEL